MRKYELGPDVNLDREQVFLANGERLTNEVAESIVAELMARDTDRQSTSTSRQHRKRLAFQVEDSLYAEIRSLTADAGLTLSEFCRRALNSYVRELRRSS
jgi:hypothetical protein